MYYFTVRFDLPNDKEDEVEALLQKARKFWLAQSGVREFHVYGDTLIDWPERKIEIVVSDRDNLQRILDSAERHELRTEMLALVKRPMWQVLELKGHGDLEETINIDKAEAMT